MVTGVDVQVRRDPVFRGTARPGSPQRTGPLPAKGFHRAHLLWSRIPREFGERFRPLAEPLARDMVEEIRQAVPDYAQPLEAYGRVVVEAVRFAITSCLDNIGNAALPHDRWSDFYHYLGRQEFAEGRNMDCLQTAARVGGRVAWRHISAFGQSCGVSSEVICTAAEAIFAYVDEMSAMAIEGFTEAQARAAGALERRRRRLLELMLAQPAVSAQAIGSLAATARWPVPDRITVIALEFRADQHEHPTPMLDDEVLMDLEGDQPCLVAPADDHHLRDLETELRGWRAAVGPTVPVTEAAVSLRWAGRALNLVQRGVLADQPITWCRDHLATLWLLSDELLVAELARRSLAPLAALTAKQRARLAETLLTWLRTRGSAPEIAAALNVHPQTIRYRMHQLQSLFGDRLERPDARLEMEIALRAQALLGTGPAAP